MNISKGKIVFVLQAGKFDHKRSVVSFRAGVDDERLANHPALCIVFVYTVRREQNKKTNKNRERNVRLMMPNKSLMRKPSCVHVMLPYLKKCDRLAPR